MSLFIRANSCLLPSSRVFGSLGGQSKQYTKPVTEKRTEETTHSIEKFLKSLMNALRIYV